MQRKAVSGILLINTLVKLKTYIMKTNKIILFTVMAAAFLAASCKKENPVTPANKDLPNAAECSFCPSEVMEPDASGKISETYASQVSFFHYGNVEVDTNSVSRTPNGYYAYQEGMAIAFNLSQLPLACMSNKVTFVHARYATNTNDNPSLVNVEFPGTPRIVTVPDSLNYFLNPYGYTAYHYFYPGYVHQNTIDGFPGVVDSIIIVGPEFESFVVGANLFESELRSICVSHQ